MIKRNVHVLVFLVMVAYSALWFTAIDQAVCHTEDSSHCVWVGPVQGNGKGRIVVNWNE